MIRYEGVVLQINSVALIIVFRLEVKLEKLLMPLIYTAGGFGEIF